MALKTQSKGSIQCNTLDSFLIQEKIDLIKIDVEGMELAVLQGAEKLYCITNHLFFLKVMKLYLFIISNVF